MKKVTILVAVCLAAFLTSSAQAHHVCKSKHTNFHDCYGDSYLSITYNNGSYGYFYCYDPSPACITYKPQVIITSPRPVIKHKKHRPRHNYKHRPRNNIRNEHIKRNQRRKR